jgi:hypothetical protein
VVQTKTGALEHYNTLGYVVMSTITITLVMMYFLNKYVQNKNLKSFTPTRKEEVQLATE